MIKNNGCCDLEYAQKLEKLGVKQDSLWTWWKPNDEADYRIKNFGRIKEYDEQYPDYCISAFTVAELGEMMPSNQYRKIYKQKYPTGKVAHFFYINPDREDELYIEADTEVNARAKMLIWLIENKKLEV